MDVFSNSHHELVHSYNNKTTILGFKKFLFNNYEYKLCSTWYYMGVGAFLFACFQVTIYIYKPHVCVNSPLYFPK